MRNKVLGTALAVLILIAPAFASAIFTMGNNPQPNEENILFLTDMNGSTITGHTNRSDTLINYTSTTDVLIGSGGQADIDAMDGLINNITASVAGGLTFQDFIINPFKPGANGDLMVSVSLSDGHIDTFTYGDIHGNNFLTITTTGGEAITSVTIDSASGFQALDQTRISGIQGVTIVPEPGTLLLLGSGSLGLAQVLRRKML